MATQKRIQDVLRGTAESNRPGHILLYPLGDTYNPKKVSYTTLYEKAKHMSYTIQSLDPFGVGCPVMLHFDDHWDTILWFWSVLLAGGLPVLSSPFTNVEEDRHRHIQAMSSLLESPICLTRSKFLHMFGNSHGMHLRLVENLSLNSSLGPGHDGNPENGIKGLTHNRNKGNQILYIQNPHDKETADSITNGDTTAKGSSGDHKEGNSSSSDGDDLLMLMLTSGSTGNAKAVRFTHKQVLAAIAGKAAVRALPPNRPLLNWVGLDHVASLIEIHLQALWLCVDQIHVSAADVVPSPKVFMDLLSRHRVSRTFAPNFFLAKLASSLENEQHDTTWDLSGLIQVASGGEANDINTCMAAATLFEKHGAPRDIITPGFGMTETCAGAIFNVNCPDYDVSESRLVASLGKCMTGIKMRITTPGVQGNLASSGEPGDLEVCGPVVFDGYYRNNTATAEAFTPDGWFRTGDQGIIDSNGNLSLVGRTRDLVNINGIKIPTGDIETKVMQAIGDRIARLVVFSSSGLYTDKVTIAYIPKTFPIPDEDVLDIARLATQACLICTATLPFIFSLQEKSISLLSISALGKISPLKMARLFENGEFIEDIKLHDHTIHRANHAIREWHKYDSNPTSEIEIFLIQCVAEILGTTPKVLNLHINTCVFDIGFSSMHIIQLKSHIKKQFDIEIPVIHIMNNSTIRCLAAYVDTQLQIPSALSEQETAVSSYDPVVVFREKGSKVPIWLIHPGVGEVLVFVGLAQRLVADDRPVFALRAAGFEANQQRFNSISQAVNVYTAAMRRYQPHGPYALAGYSYGTMLAFEAAKRLTEAGEEVRFLGSLNLPPHIKTRIRQLSWNACLLHLAYFLGFISEDMSDILEANPAFRAMARKKVTSWILDVADKSRLEELGLEEDALARWVDVAFGLQSMAAEYDPLGEVDSIDVFHAVPLKAAAESRELWLSDHLSRWADFVRDPPRFHAVEGAHYTMIGPEYIGSFADTFMKALEARGV